MDTDQLEKWLKTMLKEIAAVCQAQHGRLIINIKSLEIEVSIGEPEAAEEETGK